VNAYSDWFEKNIDMYKTDDLEQVHGDYVEGVLNTVEVFEPWIVSK
jgi:hypothetical protein